MMKIGVDLRFLINPDFVTRGVGRYIIKLLENMLNVREDIHFLLLVPQNYKEVLPGRILNHARVQFDTSLFTIAKSKIGLLQQATQFPHALAAKSVDLWHFPLVEISPPWLKTPFLTTVYDLYHYFSYLRKRKTMNEIWDWSIQKSSVRNSLHVITISEHTKQDVLNCFHKPLGKVSTVYLGIDTDIFFPEDPSFAREWLGKTYNIHEPYFLYVGGFDARKNIHRVLDIFHTLKNRQNAPHKLILSGRITKDCISLFQKVAENRLFTEVFFLDYVPDSALRHLYAGATAFLFPSSFEGFGLPLLEALACHTPIIAFDNTSIPEVVGNTISLIPDGDWGEFSERMRNFVEGFDEAFALDIEKVESHLEQFTWLRAAKQTLLLYEKCLSFES